MKERKILREKYVKGFGSGMLLLLMFMQSMVASLLERQFIEAVESGNTGAITTLCKENSRLLDYQDSGTGQSALHYAVNAQKRKVVALLLNMKADATIQDHEGNTPLHCAAQLATPEIIKLLLSNKHTNVNSRNYADSTPLHCVADYKKGQEVIKPVKKRKRSIPNRYGEVVKLLLEAGAEREAEDRNHRTPLYMAAKKGRTEVVQELISRGAHGNFLNEDNNYTPLHVAADQGHLAVVKLLLKAGVDKDSGEDLTTPLHLAAWAGHVAIIEELCGAGAHKNSLDVDGYSPLHLAVKNGRSAVVKRLIELRADPDIRDAHGVTPKIEGDEDTSNRTPLHIAAKKGNEEIVDILLQAHARIDEEDVYGHTPLHRAIKGNHTRVVAILVEAGANVEYADQDDHTPLFCSLKWSVPSEITDILILVGNASLKDVHFFPPEVQLRLEQRGFYRPTFERDFKKSKVSLKAHFDALMAYIETLCIPRVLAVIIVDYHRCVDIRRHFFIEAREQGWKDDLLLVR